MTDEECIALAVLHGAEFTSMTGDKNWWFVNANNAADPVALKQRDKTRHYFFPSREAAARAYCEHHGLLGEVT